MAKRLTENITSKYFEAANKMTSKKALRKIVAYVESYDDVLFWRTVLGRYEDDTRYFEIMLPTRDTHLQRGKKAAIGELLSHVGKDMIACVDADYDFLLQGKTENSRQMLYSPYIFHTYVYAIENYQSYAPGLHNACVMVTLNDHKIFDFEGFLREFSMAIYPLFLWSIWFYRSTNYREFTIGDFNKIIEIGRFRLRNTEHVLKELKKKVERKLYSLEKKYPAFHDEYIGLAEELGCLGVTPENTYLYIQGHHMFDNVVVPAVTKVCEQLVKERQEEIRKTSMHSAQEQAEMQCYVHSVEEVTSMLKKNTIYQYSDQFQHILFDVENYLKDDSLQDAVEANSKNV